MNGNVTKYIFGFLIISALIVGGYTLYANIRNSQSINNGDTFLPTDKLDGSNDKCGQNATGEGMTYYPIKYDLSEENIVSLTLDIALTESLQQSKNYTALIFYDGVQIEHGGEAFNLMCGQSTTKTYSIPVQDRHVPNVIHFEIRELPILPKQIEKTSIKSLKSIQPKIIDFVMNYANVETLHIASLPEFKPSQFSNIDTSIITRSPDNLVLNHLYEGVNLEPIFTVVLDEEQTNYNFKVRFQESTTDTGITTITCVLDDVQQNMFNGQPYWSGKLDSNEEVQISGQVEVKSKGWHQLRCIVLNSLYDSPIELDTNNILTTYIYKP